MRREDISAPRSRELFLLIFSVIISALGMTLACLAMEQSALRALRVVAVGGGFIVASFLLTTRGRQRDYLLLPWVSLLCGLGIILVWRVDPLAASRQVIWMLLGLAAMAAVYLLVRDVRHLARYKYTAGVLALGLMVVTMIWGQERNGARLWLGIPGLISFQPGDLAKVLMCIFLAGYVADKGDMIRAQVASRPGIFLPGLKYMGPLLVVVLFCLAVFVGMRDLGTAVLFFGLFVAVTYLATGRKTYALLSVILFAVGTVAAVHVFQHVQTRFDAWLDPWADPAHKGYQILQGLFAMAAGGVSGVGLGNGFPGAVPEAGTDMIYTVAGQELGLLGAVALLLLYVLVVTRSFNIGWRSNNPFGALLATCLAIVFGLQTLVIIGGVLRLIPLTGITMPFVSYGGTSVVVNFIALGLLLAVSRDCIPEAGGGNVSWENRRVRRRTKV